MKILVCTDGEPHSGAAMEWAVQQACSRAAAVTALYVVDPWLKKFHNELYSQGRRRYLEYVDECLQREAERAREAFESLCRSHGVGARFRFRYGEPLQEILDEMRTAAPDLVVTGGKSLGRWARLRSRNLPRQLQRRASVPVSVITATSMPAVGPVLSGS